MNITILSVFSQLYSPFLQTSLVKRAQEQKIITVDVDNFFSFVSPKERIDAPTFGHGAGMLIRPDVIQKAIEAKESVSGPAFKIFFSPHGKKLDQRLLTSLYERIQQHPHLMIIAGRYEGMDARVEEHYADEIVSVGDFVLMGGDLPAMMLLEGLLRLIPGVVGKQESIQEESFSGSFVDYPEYTTPVMWNNKEVPEIVRSGNHAGIAQWRHQEAVRRTVLGHFNWLRSTALSVSDKKDAVRAMPSHYVALLHGDVIVDDEGKVGATSVTSIDIHDIARSSRTYGIKNFFIITPLVDQQKIVRKLLDFWQTGAGLEYNASRYEAIKQVEIMVQLQDAIERITQQEGQAPLIVATSARSIEHPGTITFYDQTQVWQSGRPVLFLFGTGRGIAQEILARSDYLLVPIEGLSEYNHLSVRSAVAIALDRWIGINLKKS